MDAAYSSPPSMSMSPPEGAGDADGELLERRRRGEVSCAECRRLKIKCDKALPCGACVRRGCDALCPLGTLATAQGTKFVLAATGHLHAAIGALRERARVLEGALAQLVHRHPLLLPGAEDAAADAEEDRELDEVARREGWSMEDLIAVNAQAGHGALTDGATSASAAPAPLARYYQQLSAVSAFYSWVSRRLNHPRRRHTTTACTPRSRARSDTSPSRRSLPQTS
jgi:hypothetical protein